MRGRAGFSIMEIVIALAVTLVVLVSLVTVFSNSNKLAVASRHRSVAILIAQGLMDDVETHVYGRPAPAVWAETEERPVSVWVGHREQQMLFHKTVAYQNGSFVGTGSGNSDLVTITITWREAVGDQQTSPADPMATPSAAAAGDNKELQVQVPVWR